MDYYPYIFGRTGGGSINCFENLKISHSLNQIIDKYSDLSDTINLVSCQLMDLLFEAINKETDQKIQNKLLNLKRDIYNIKDIESYSRFIEDKVTEPGLKEILQDYSTYKNQRAELINLGIEFYLKEFSNSLNELSSILRYKFIRNGILFSSEKLSATIDKHDTVGIQNNKKKVVFELLKYACRSITKTTPFSTFNSSFCLNENDGVFSPIHFDQKSFILANNSFYLFFKRLFLFVDDIKKNFQVSVNKSIIDVGDYYQLSININNNDSLKRIKKSAICEYIKGLSGSQDCLTFLELATDIAFQTGATNEKAFVFTDTLIKEGFLIVHFPISIFSKDWPVQLANCINESPDLRSIPILKQMYFFLNKYEQTRLALELHNEYNARKSNLLQLKSVFEELLSSISQCYPQFPYIESIKNIACTDFFYEDYFASQSDNMLTNLDLPFGQIGNAFKQLSLLNTNDYRKGLFAESILIGLNVNELSFLSFYELYCEKHKEFETKQELAFKEIIESKISFFVSAANSNKQELDLCELFQKNNTNELENIGFGLYFQIYKSNKTQVIVINSDSSGFGKNISRFLNYTDENSIRELKKFIEIKFPDCIIADVHDASIHNINSYPQLTDYLIEIPGAEEDHRNYIKIPLSELTISIDDGIKLMWKGKKVIPFHFSMENINRKSSLVKLLDLFSINPSSGLLSVKVIEELFWEKLKHSDEEIMIVPRLEYGNNIVLNRKKWLVRKNVFNSFLTDGLTIGTSFISFLGMSLWQKKYQIPNEVFVKLSRQHEKRKNLHKPQYLNFKIPLLVECFLTMLKEAEEIIEITEMLPNTDQLTANVTGEKFVCEYIVNLK